MRTLTLEKFTGGIDRRKGRATSDADKLWDLTNAYVTTGGQISKRPGLRLVTELETGTVGLQAGLGVLNTFYAQGTITHAHSLFTARKVVHPTLSAQPVERIWDHDVFNDALYVAVGYANGDVRHHYLDGGSPTHVVDGNCPNTKSIAKAASKMFAVDGPRVRFCKTGDARDWTAASDAGFLPTHLQGRGAEEMTGLGLYRGQLVAFTEANAQMWVVDPDPQNMAFDEIVENVGTRYPLSVHGVAGDLYLLSPFGFRSIALLSLTQNLADVDVGSPIDSLVVPGIDAVADARGLFSTRHGQYWCLVGDNVWVFSFSRTAKLAAWSRYVYPFPIAAMEQIGGVIYLRSANDVYAVDDAVADDDGDQFEVAVEPHFLDAAKPGMLKQWVGADLVMSGEADLQWRYDARRPEQITAPVRVSGTTRSGGLVPVELMSTEITPRVTLRNRQPWTLEAISIHHEHLGPM